MTLLPFTVLALEANQGTSISSSNILRRRWVFHSIHSQNSLTKGRILHRGSFDRGYVVIHLDGVSSFEEIFSVSEVPWLHTDERHHKKMPFPFLRFPIIVGGITLDPSADQHCAEKSNIS